MGFEIKDTLSERVGTNPPAKFNEEPAPQTQSGQDSGRSGAPSLTAIGFGMTCALIDLGIDDLEDMDMDLTPCGGESGESNGNCSGQFVGLGGEAVEQVLKGLEVTPMITTASNLFPGLEYDLLEYSPPPNAIQVTGTFSTSGPEAAAAAGGPFQGTSPLFSNQTLPSFSDAFSPSSQKFGMLQLRQGLQNMRRRKPRKIRPPNPDALPNIVVWGVPISAEVWARAYFQVDLGVVKAANVLFGHLYTDMEVLTCTKSERRGTLRLNGVKMNAVRVAVTWMRNNHLKDGLNPYHFVAANAGRLTKEEKEKLEKVFIDRRNDRVRKLIERDENGSGDEVLAPIIARLRAARAKIARRKVARPKIARAKIARSKSGHPKVARKSAKGRKK